MVEGVAVPDDGVLLASRERLNINSARNMWAGRSATNSIKFNDQGVAPTLSVGVQCDQLRPRACVLCGLRRKKRKHETLPRLFTHHDAPGYLYY